MKYSKTYENYPCWIVVISSLVSVAMCLIGAVIIAQIGSVWMGVYLLYVFFLEVRLVKGGCVNCYYHGKYCAFGKGKISGWFFKKGSSGKFRKNKISWKDILPDFLVSLIPLIIGIALLILDFDWLLLILVILLVMLASVGNGFIRGSLACKFCKQREIGCPAEQLFSKNKK